MRSVLLLFALVCCSSGLWSQSSPAAPAGAKPDPYAAESIVIERGDIVYSMAADGTGWRLRTVAVRVQSEAAVKQLGVISIPFAGASERVEIEYARVRRPDGTVVETPLTDALEMPEEVTRQAPFYSDLKQKQIPIRNLRVGDTLEWQAKIVRTKAEASGEFWGQENFDKESVALEESVELRVPKGKAVKVWSPTMKAVESVAGEERVYRWTTSQLKTTSAQQAETEAKKKTPWTAEQELDAKEGRLPTIVWTTFASWEAVGAWYRGLEGDRMAPSAEVKAKVAEVTAGKTTEEEKVKAIYGYVGTQVRYIGVAFGIGRYQPHTAGEVLENQYGDCKDKHTLLAAMLGALGVQTDAVLIGAGIRFNPDVPSPEAFNHLITLATVGGKPVWLDATAEVAPYQMLTAVIRDHQALAVPQTGAARLERTPAGLPFKPFQTMNAAGTLDKDGVSESKITWTLRGDDELAVRTVLRQIAPAQYDQFMQNMSRGMGYGGTTSHAEFGRAEDTSGPLVIHYDYHREKAGNDWEHYRTISQLAPVSLPVIDEKEPPVRAIDLGVPRIESSTAAMKLPEGWSAELPEVTHAHSAYANLDQTYHFDKGTLYAERKVEVLVDKVPQKEWLSYKKWTDAANLGNEQYVQLIRPGANKDTFSVVGGQGAMEIVGVGGTAGGGGESAKAAALVKSAYEAVQRREFDTAIKDLDEAKALNEHQAGLWSTYGFASLRRGGMTEALNDYEKELELHPDAVAVYQDIVTVDLALGKHEDAIKAMRRWVQADPADSRPTLMLVQTLLQDEDFVGAVKGAEMGIAGLPEDKRHDENLQMLLGTAQLKAGMKEKGAATLVALLKSENPFILNGAAYALADENEQLDLAEKSTRAALAKLGEESREWTLDENPQVLRGKSQIFLATWDTMGWVLFREGKTDEAERYVRATWLNLQNPAVGEHLGDVLLKKGEKANAVKAYELALGTISPYDAMGKKPDKPSAIEVRLKKKITAAAVSSKDLNGNYIAALQDMRKVSLGSANGLNGAAEYKLLLGEHGIVRAEPVGDKTIDGGEERLKKTLLTGYWPAGLDGRLVKGAFLNCHSGVCELVFEP